MKLNSFTKGWLVGDFEPAILRSKDVEVGIKEYLSGTVESNHVHRIITEYTVILSGSAKLLGNEYSKGDIVTIPPGTSNKFEALTDCMLLVIKTPSCPTDKYELD